MKTAPNINREVDRNLIIFFLGASSWKEMRKDKQEVWWCIAGTTSPKTKTHVDRKRRHRMYPLKFLNFFVVGFGIVDQIRKE